MSVGVVMLAGCGRESREAPRSLPLPVHVITSDAPVERMRVAPPDSTRAWIASVSRQAPPPAVRPAAPAAGELALELPPASPDTVAPEPPPDLVVDPDLKPPVPRAPVDLRMPASFRGHEPAVELDVHVDERGYVDQATWAGGSADSALVDAAREAAMAMRFYPALRAGQPIGVWCRQRFDFGARP